MRSMCVCVCYCGCSAAIMDPFTPLIYAFAFVCFRACVCVDTLKHLYMCTLSRTHTRKHSCTETYIHTRMHIFMYSKTYLFTNQHKQAEVKRHMMHKTLPHAATHCNTLTSASDAEAHGAPARQGTIRTRMHGCARVASPVPAAPYTIHTNTCTRSTAHALIKEHTQIVSLVSDHIDAAASETLQQSATQRPHCILRHRAHRGRQGAIGVCVCLSLVFIFFHTLYISLASPMRSCICGYACRCMGFECL